MTKSRQKAEEWEKKENDAAKHHKEALDQTIRAAKTALRYAVDNNLSVQEIAHAAQEVENATKARASRYRVSQAGLNADARMADLSTRSAERAFTLGVNADGELSGADQEIVQQRGRSMAPTEGQGIPDYVDGPSEQYDGIARMIRATLAEGQYTDPDKSVLIRAGVKLVHPETYAGGSDLEEFEVFVAGILRWLKMNCLLGATSTEMQVSYLGTRLTGEAQEWFYRNVERYDREVRDWTLESVIQGLQKRFLHTLTHHHASNKFDTVSQGTKTVQEVLNDLKKYAARMIHPPDVYTFCKRFVAALRESLRNEVLKKGYNAEFSTIEQLYETARMVEEASRYNHGMRCVENATAMAASSAKLTAQKTRPQTGQTRASLGRESTTQQMPMARAYSAPKPEQRFAQVKDSSTKPSYRQKPLP